MQPEDANKLEKLAGAIQVGSGPLDLGHEGVHNLVPKEQDALEDLLGKRQPLNDAERADLRDMKEIMRPAIPYDRLHPGFDSLAPNDQK